jgi:hypothetical protein
MQVPRRVNAHHAAQVRESEAMVCATVRSILNSMALVHLRTAKSHADRNANPLLDALIHKSTSSMAVIANHSSVSVTT